MLFDKLDKEEKRRGGGCRIRANPVTATITNSMMFKNQHLLGMLYVIFNAN